MEGERDLWIRSYPPLTLFAHRIYGPRWKCKSPKRQAQKCRGAEIKMKDKEEERQAA